MELKLRLQYNVLGRACAWNGATFFLFFTFFPRQGTAGYLHLRKGWHGTEVPRPTYLVVLGTAKNFGTGAEPAPFTVH